MKAHRNLLNPTPRQIKYRNELWAKALEENPKKARGQMRKNGGKCCLAVGEDCAIECGLDISKSQNTDLIPVAEVYKFFGWIPCGLYLKYKGKEIHADVLNDGNKHETDIPENGLSHKKIAQLVRETFCV